MKNLKIYLLLGLLSLAFFSCNKKEGEKPSQDKNSENSKAKTAFQTSSPWMPEIDVRADVAIVYGVHGNPTDGRQELTFEERVESWRERGYNTHFMTGIAWGSYQDYFLGEWDGENHLGEGQVQQNGDTIWHGHNVPYIVPTESFIEYMKEEVIEPVIEAGISSIYLEEPEFWSRAGYSSAFKKAWQDYYNEEWKPQHESPENTWLSNKLKYELYYDAVDKVSSYAKEYGKEKGMDVKVYVPTHSLVNYSSWQIVSPEASLASLPGIDGYIAQVWTGTSREPTFFNGEEKERTFENAFLEYGSMVSMTAPTGRKMFFLTDPIEDRKKSWDDYKKNYQATFAAKLLYPMVANYEVMPWPERIYTKPYSVEGSDEEVLIPEEYATQMQIMINALNNMPESDNEVSGSQGIGVLMGNSLMFQRFPTHDGFEDPKFSNFYGQTLPLLKRGIPVETVHMENLSYAATLENIEVLVMSYSNMKPHSPEVHEKITEWVKKGGVLIYAGRDDDPYQNVREWWNTGDFNFKKPSQHLLEEFEIEKRADTQRYSVGDGVVHFIEQNPKEFVLEANADSNYLDIVRNAFEKDASAGDLELKNNLHLKRGNYEIIAVMDESIDGENFELEGSYIDLFDPNLPTLSTKSIKPGEQVLLFNLENLNDRSKPQVLASASRIYDEEFEDDTYRFLTKSPKNTTNSMRILLPERPSEISIVHSDEGEYEYKEDWDSQTNTLLLNEFENSSDGLTVEIKW